MILLIFSMLLSWICKTQIKKWHEWTYVQIYTEVEEQEMLTTTHRYLRQHPAEVTMETPSEPMNCKLCSLPSLSYDRDQKETFKKI